MLPSRVLGFCAIAGLNLISSVSASDGDDLEEFEDCLYQCNQITCFKNPYNIIQQEFEEALKRNNHRFHRYEPSWRFEKDLSGHLRAMLWDCESNCDYQCQRIITAERKAKGEEIYQFHGKWPFLRVFGIQELASAVFSIANFFPHYIGFWEVSKTIVNLPSEKYNALKRPLRNVQFVAFVTMCAWIFSTIYHVRDFLITERLDYYFAGLTVLSGFYGIGYRYLRLYLPTRRLYLFLFTALCILSYCGHVYYLVSDWLYTYNMRANIAVGILQNVFWALTCYSLYYRYYAMESNNENYDLKKHLQYTQGSTLILGDFYNRSAKLFSLYPLAICSIVLLGISLEIFDFPPIFYDLVDAHSLWHLVTAVPSYMGWYKWMIWDICENVWADLLPVKKKEE